MSKKIIVFSSVLVVVFAAAIPVYAQTPSPSIPQTNQSFFGEIASFFGNIFHHQGGQDLNSGQGQSQSGPMEGGEQVSNAPSGTMNPRPSGQPTYQTMQQYRLSQLVKEGKITQTQEQEILTELTTVQNQLKSWAQTNGIDPSYVMGGPMMFGQGQQQGGIQPTGQQGQMPYRPMYRYQGQGINGGQQSGSQNSQQGGVGQQPPQQGQAQP